MYCENSIVWKKNENTIKTILGSDPSEFLRSNMFCKKSSVKIYRCRSAAIGWFIQCEKCSVLNHFVPLPPTLSHQLHQTTRFTATRVRSSFALEYFYLTSFRMADAKPDCDCGTTCRLVISPSSYRSVRLRSAAFYVHAIDLFHFEIHQVFGLI